ncbi:MAG: glycosyltransferase [Proteobacteria bacterium]|nr:glycosyltransferase [Pseudomonadota bacterium]
MKILQVMAGAQHGGAETAFVDMCLALHDAGEQIEIVTRPNPLRVMQLSKAGLKVHELPFGGVLDVYTTLRVKKIIRDFQPHIVQTWMSRAAQKTPKWKADTGIPRYLVVSRLGGYYKLKHFHHTDFFTTITPDIRVFLIRQGVKEENVRHINNFAETEKPARPVRRAALDTPENAPVLLALSRLHQSKAIDVVIDALPDLPGVYFWVAGEGPLRNDLESRARDNGVADRVRFLGWRDDRAALLQAADICVFPSRYEPFGTVFVQAWAQKRPFIASAADGPRQYVRDGEDGLLFPVDDTGAFAAAARRLLTDLVLAERLAEKGYLRYLDEFTKENTVSAYLDFYHNILSRENLVSVA